MLEGFASRNKTILRFTLTESLLPILLFSIQQLPLNIDSLDVCNSGKYLFSQEMGCVWQSYMWSAVEHRMQLLTSLCLSNNK